MSIGGPRPALSSQLVLRERRQKLGIETLKPGITGLAQTKNCRGPINNLDDLLKRLKYDLHYVKKASLGYDMKMIARTVLMMFKHDEKVR